eukprot:10858493-Lingulodinium_polyedra.AAC.1
MDFIISERAFPGGRMLLWSRSPQQCIVVESTGPQQYTVVEVSEVAVHSSLPLPGVAFPQLCIVVECAFRS